MRNVYDRWSSLVAAALLLGGCARVAEAGPPRSRVAIAVSIVAPDFRDNFSAASRLDVEGKLVNKAARLCGDHFGFVDWMRAADLEPGKTPDGVLRIELVGEPRAGASKISLAFSGAVDGPAVELPNLPPVLVYEAWESQPTHAPSELRAKLEVVLDTLFANDDFRRRLHEQFLRQVPLSRRVIVRDGDKRLVVPVSWKALRARRESVLSAVFAATSPLNTSGEGQIRLSPEGGVSAEDLSDAVMCRVLLFTYPSVTVEGVAAWHERISALLADGALQRMAIYMEDYRREVHLSGGLAESPNP